MLGRAHNTVTGSEDGEEGGNAFTFVGLSVNKITKKLVDRFSPNLVGGCGGGMYAL